ncbi:hypothetical protein ACM46_01465 [Chryseobacterium angstadtii]|uniref:Uncharacterized protein n=1 Tax=Chryseobacterium angstadtii TaxID=558151 RepID=A0A0J7IJY8_9FLAO|nr:hypothetical protein [Chryseobacterium angstadtii]KMQ66249.1 hypothetical protein ACM46_01465 [Chryseobacterium angstadtii]
MKKVSIVFSLFLMGFYFSQSSVLHNLNNNRLMSQAVNKIGVNGVPDNEFVGSPFLETAFLPSAIKGENGTYLLRYNIYNDEIILKNDDKYFKIPKEELDYFNINNKYIVRLINGGYYIQSSSEKGNYTIVRKEGVKFTEGKISENTYGQNQPAKFTPLKPDYFLYDTKNKTLIPLKEGDLKNAFPSKDADLVTFFKKNKLKKSEDYNALLEVIVK